MFVSNEFTPYGNIKKAFIANAKQHNVLPPIVVKIMPRLPITLTKITVVMQAMFSIVPIKT